MRLIVLMYLAVMLLMPAAAQAQTPDAVSVPECDGQGCFAVIGNWPTTCTPHNVYMRLYDDGRRNVADVWMSTRSTGCEPTRTSWRQEFELPPGHWTIRIHIDARDGESDRHMTLTRRVGHTVFMPVMH